MRQAGRCPTKSAQCWALNKPFLATTLEAVHNGQTKGKQLAHSTCGLILLMEEPFGAL